MYQWDRYLLLARRSYRVKRYWYGRFVPTICRSSHVSSGDMSDWIGMLFGVVSGVVEFGEAIKNPAYRIPQTEYSGCLDISAHA